MSLSEGSASSNLQDNHITPSSPPTNEESTLEECSSRRNRPIVEWMFPDGHIEDEVHYIDTRENNESTAPNAESVYVVDVTETVVPIEVEGKIDTGYVYVNYYCGAVSVRNRHVVMVLILLLLLFGVLAGFLAFTVSRDTDYAHDEDATHNSDITHHSLVPSASPSKLSSSFPSNLSTFVLSDQPSVETWKEKFVERIMLNVSGTVVLEHDSFQNRALQWILSEGDNNNTEHMEDSFIDVSLIVQRYGAMLFYFSLHGESWSNANRYGSKSNVCLWHGLTCDNEHNVVKLILTSNNLRGELPNEIGTVFPRLYKIDLWDNKIEGTLPKSVFLLEHMREIDLSRNELTGEIPDNLENLGRLRKLSFVNNDLEGIIPTTIKYCDNLVKLKLTGNMITGSIPTELAALEHLESLYLHRNLLTNTLPPGLSYDSFSIVRLYENGLNGTVPGELWNGRNLEDLDLADNFFTGTLPETVTKGGSRLKRLDVHNNRLRGTIPESLGSLATLQKLYLSGNDFEGTIPASFEGLVNVEILNIGCISVTGTVPTEIGSLTKLLTVRMAKNALSGTMPQEICRLDLVTLIADCKSHPSGDEFCSCCTSCIEEEDHNDANC